MLADVCAPDRCQVAIVAQRRARFCLLEVPLSASGRYTRHLSWAYHHFRRALCDVTKRLPLACLSWTHPGVLRVYTLRAWINDAMLLVKSLLPGISPCRRCLCGRVTALSQRHDKLLSTSIADWLACHEHGHFHCRESPR